MRIEVRYFGILAEITGRNSEELYVDENTVQGLKKTLIKRYPEFKNKDFRIAQDQELVPENAEIIGEEIAVLPPFSGG